MLDTEEEEEYVFFVIIFCDLDFRMKFNLFLLLLVLTTIFRRGPFHAQPLGRIVPPSQHLDLNISFQITSSSLVAIEPMPLQIEP